MLTPGGGSRIYLALRPVDMRKGFDGLTAQVAQVLQEDPFGGQLFLFRSRRGDRLKAVWWDGTGLCLFAKRVERGSFVWPVVKEGAITLTSAQLAMLIEGLDWRRAVLMTETVKPGGDLVQLSDRSMFEVDSKHLFSYFLPCSSTWQHYLPTRHCCSRWCASWLPL